MSKLPEITLAHRASRSDQVLFQNLDGEAVLLDLASETYFGLNEVGSRVWQLIEASPVLADVHHTLCEEFDADATLIAHDLMALVGQLVNARLVTVR